MSPTNSDWHALIDAQDVSKGLSKSEDLRLPRDPHYALKALEARVAEIASEQSMTRKGVS